MSCIYRLGSEGTKEDAMLSESLERKSLQTTAT